jgi:light-regulated signal transduction histidine kinase (bacteriophytochrome)
MKEAQLQLEKAAATLKTVFDSAQTGMFTFAPEYDASGEIIDFRFVMVNSTMSAYVDQAPEALAGELGSKWFPGYLTNGVFQMYRHTFEAGEPQRKEVHYNTDGLDIYLDLQSVKIERQVLVTLTDHTNLRRSQLELEHTVKALERSNANLEDFAHAASHDMKEPIRKILTFTDRLITTIGERLTDSERRLFQGIETSAARMQQLVEDLLELSHVSEKPRDMEWVDLNQKIQAVLGDLELAIEEKKAQVTIHSLPTLRGNRRQLQQLFQNLIGNALKYSKRDVQPVITIKSSTIKGREAPVPFAAELGDESFHLIEVSDNGIGFEQQYAEQIFKMFQRLHGKLEYSGTGVGLSITRKVVENHNGYIWAESELNKGATFKMLFPIA